MEVVLATAAWDHRNVAVDDTSKVVLKPCPVDFVEFKVDSEGIPETASSMADVNIMPVTPPYGKMGTWMVTEVLNCHKHVWLSEEQMVVFKLVLATVKGDLLTTGRTVQVCVGIPKIQYSECFPPVFSVISRDARSVLAQAMWLSVATAVTGYSYFSGRRCFRDTCSAIKIKQLLPDLESRVSQGEGVTSPERDTLMSPRRERVKGHLKEVLGDINIIEEDFSALETSVLSRCHAGRRGANKCPRRWALDADARTGLPEFKVELENRLLIIALSGRGTGDANSRHLYTTDSLVEASHPPQAEAFLKDFGSAQEEIMETIKKLHFVSPEFYRFNFVTRWNCWRNASLLTFKVELGSEKLSEGENYDQTSRLRSKLVGLKAKRNPVMSVSRDKDAIVEGLLDITGLIQMRNRWHAKDVEGVIDKMAGTQLASRLWRSLLTREDCIGTTCFFLAMNMTYRFALQDPDPNDREGYVKRKIKEIHRAVSKVKWAFANVREHHGVAQVTGYVSMALVAAISTVVFTLVFYGLFALKRNVSFEDYIQTVVAIAALLLPLNYKLSEILFDPDNDLQLGYLGGKCHTTDVISLMVESGGKFEELCRKRGIGFTGSACMISNNAKVDGDGGLVITRPMTQRELMQAGKEIKKIGELRILFDRTNQRASEMSIDDRNGVWDCLEWQDYADQLLKIKMSSASLPKGARVGSSRASEKKA